MPGFLCLERRRSTATDNGDTMSAFPARYSFPLPRLISLALISGPRLLPALANSSERPSCRPRNQPDLSRLDVPGSLLGRRPRDLLQERGAGHARDDGAICQGPGNTTDGFGR